MDSIPALTTKNLSVGYKGKALLTLPDLQIPEGKTVALIGQNGIGKSTLLRTLTREQPPISGEIYIQGENISKLSRRALARKLSVVTTDRDISPGLLVKEIVAMGRHPHISLLSRMSSEDEKVIESAMQQTGIIHKANFPFGELSDGERQKTMIARALAQQSPIMILDEPFSFLDTAARIEILDLLKQLAHKFNRAILFSSHDVAQALRMADEMWLITTERKVSHGTPEELVQSGDINKLFSTDNVRFDATQNDFVSI